MPFTKENMDKTSGSMLVKTIDSPYDLRICKGLLDIFVLKS